MLWAIFWATFSQTHLVTLPAKERRFTIMDREIESRQKKFRGKKVRRAKVSCFSPCQANKLEIISALNK
jgi:hypothetical protein